MHLPHHAWKSRTSRRSIFGAVSRAALAMLLLVPLAMGTVLAGTAAAAGPITGQASPSTTPVGGTSNDSATFAAVENGAVFFRLYAPGDTTCSNVIASEGRGVFAAPSQTYSTTAARTMSIVGTYRWVARYQNNPQTIVYETECNDPAQQVVVTGPLTISGQASGTVQLGGATVSDSATLAQGVDPTGTILFRLYAPNDPACILAPVYSDTQTVDGADTYSSGSYTPTVAGTHRWRATYSGDVNDPSLSTTCGTTSQNVEVTSATPQITTQASPSVEVGGVISDAATLTSGVNPTGTVTFTLYGPGDPTCSGAPAFTSTGPVSGGTAASANFTTVVAGTYSWVASYSGDGQNAAATEPCGSPNESVIVTAPVSISGQATPATVALGAGTIADAATLADGRNPTGTMTFDLFGPGDAGCVSIIFTSTSPVNGAGTYPSVAFTPTQVGTYRWVATYSGDGDDDSVATVCGAGTQNVEVTAGATALAPSPPATVTVGGFSTQNVTLSGPAGPAPTGTILFQTFGPGDLTCANERGSVIETVNGYGPYSFTVAPDQAGTWRNRATYSGDASHLAATTACGDPNNQMQVLAATPQISTQASGSVSSGGSITDVATVVGGYFGTGTITFNLYGPDDATCAGPAVFTSVQPVAGDGDYASSPYTVFLPGTYRWIASYSGDTNNDPDAGACNDPGESVFVGATPQLATHATGSVPAGFTIGDTATLTEGFIPTGTITFSLYGPDDASCSGPAIATSVVDVAGNGDYESDVVPIGLPGTYRWIANYSGDEANEPVAGACNDPNESVEVTTSIEITNVPDRLSLPAPGGTFTFTASVTNSTDAAYELASLVDDVYGDLDGQGSCAVPVTIAPNSSYECTFTGDFTGVAGDSQTSTITVTAEPMSGGLSVLALAPVGDAAAAATTTVSLTAGPVVAPVANARPGVGALASTGASTGRLGALGLALMIAGGLTLVASRRRSWLSS